jgi:Kef-type K+ transport system membrane component KefB
MHTDLPPLITGIIIFISSLISLRLGISVAIIEILLGAAAGNMGLEVQEWMRYLAGFGGIVLTFLAGTEIDVDLMRRNFRESFSLGFFSFLIPFAGVSLFCRLYEGWNLSASLIAGTALSTTSLAVVYSVLVETGLSSSILGKFIMAATFVTDMCTALALSILFMKPTFYFIAFIIGSIIVILAAIRFSHKVFHDRMLRNKVIEPEIKYIFLLLFSFMYFAQLGGGHAVLPAFVLGLIISRHFTETSKTKEVRNRLRTVAYAIITPFFFIVGGISISFPLIYAALGLFVVLFALKIATKFLGVYFLAKRYLPEGSMYTTLLMSTGLTFGTISSLFGLNAGLIDRTQYSILVGVVVASAVIPTVIAQKWFYPVHSEDVVDIENGKG